MGSIKSPLKELRKFGFLIGGLLLVIAWWRFRYGIVGLIVGSVGFLFFVFGLVLPKFLGHVYTAWMFLGEKVGFIVNRIVLAAFFLILITPFGSACRLWRRDPLRLKWEREKGTYFERKVIQQIKSFEHMF